METDGASEKKEKRDDLLQNLLVGQLKILYKEAQAYFEGAKSYTVDKCVEIYRHLDKGLPNNKLILSSMIGFSTAILLAATIPFTNSKDGDSNILFEPRGLPREIPHDNSTVFLIPASNHEINFPENRNGKNYIVVWGTLHTPFGSTGPDIRQNFLNAEVGTTFDNPFGTRGSVCIVEDIQLNRELLTNRPIIEMVNSINPLFYEGTDLFFIFTSSFEDGKAKDTYVVACDDPVNKNDSLTIFNPLKGTEVEIFYGDRR